MPKININQNLSSATQHRAVQKSTTLNRRYVKRPTPVKIKINAEAEAPKEKAKKTIAVSGSNEKKIETPKKVASRKITHLAVNAEAEPVLKSDNLEDAILEAKNMEYPTISRFHVEKEAPAAVAAKPTPIKIETEDLPPAPNPYASAVKARMSAMEVRKAAGRSAEFYVGPSMTERKNAQIEKALAEMEPVTAPVKVNARAERAELAKKARAERQAAKIAQRNARLAEKQARAAAKKQPKVILEPVVATKPEPSILEKNVEAKDEMTHGLRKGRGKRIALAAFCSIACVVALGALVYTNIPDISVRVTAMQSGIDAQYPSYVPRDYSLGGVYVDEDGAVVMEFNGPESKSFTLSEVDSSWDSTALLNNFVKKNWKEEDYTAVRENGITIYIRNSDAVWVNGGILYKISASAGTLSKKQIKNIVTSM